MEKRIFYSISLIILMVFLLSFSAWAVPRLVNSQGKLTNAEGVALNGLYIMKFHLFAQEIGGSSLWIEQQEVTVTDGIYNIQLGAINPLSVDLFSNDSIYLEVEVFNSGTGWEILSPRQCLTSTAFAINADTVDGIEAADLEESDEIDNKISTHALNENAHHTKTTSFAELTDTATDAQIPNNITINYAASAGNADTVDGVHIEELAPLTHSHDTRYYRKTEVDSLIAALESRIAQLEDLLQGVTRIESDIEFSGVNVHIVNGNGTTDGEVNGLGNLIVGYNELRSRDNDRTGSHNIVVGRRHNYSSYGGLVVGSNNTISGAHASVSGGFNNTASNSYSSISGGQSNSASGNASSVSGGENNAANGSSSSISGGKNNTADGSSASVSGGTMNKANSYFSSVSGGNNNTASGNSSCISGGKDNAASGAYSSISGGNSNTASNSHCSVSGGRNNEASGIYSFVAGGGSAEDTEGNIAFAQYSAILGGRSNFAGDLTLTDHTIGDASSISGGSDNTTRGESSSISGGSNNRASGNYSSVSGGYNNTASADSSSVSGGSGNEASGDKSSVSGGSSNEASGDKSSVSGGFINRASNTWCSVSGGYKNTANGGYCSVTGGYYNTASGTYSSISGGYYRSVSGEYDWRAGALFQDQ